MNPIPGLSILLFLELLFFILLLIFTIQAGFLGYHWFTYGSSRKVSLTSLCIYLSGGAILLLIYSTALNLIS